MNKHGLLTIAGITLSIAMAAGGWIMTNALIDIKSAALLSEKRIIFIDAPSQILDSERNIENGTEQERRTLTEQDIYEILLNWEAAGGERAHEPTDTQLNMEQAVEAARSGLDYFGEQGVIPTEILEKEFEKINAYLCQNQALGQTPQFLDPIYSYWNVELTGECFDAALTINAVTGQIWRAGVVITAPDVFLEGRDAIKILNAFVSYLGMNINDDKSAIGISKYETVADANIAGSMIQAFVKIQTGKISGASVITEISMYLSAQPAGAGTGEIITEWNK